MLIPVLYNMAQKNNKKEDKQKESPGKVFERQIVINFTENVIETYMPIIGAADEPKGFFCGIMQDQFKSMLPIYAMADRKQYDYYKEQYPKKDNVGNSKYLYKDDLLSQYKENESTENTGMIEGISMEELMTYENANVSGEFTAHEMMEEIDLTQYEDYESLVKRFYTIDSNTMAGSNELNINEFRERNMAVEKNGEGPQILIYHTHSQEAYADSVPGDESTTIMGVGDRLAQILSDDYGYNVLHYREKFDVETRDEAYSKALPDIEQVLKDNPTIEVVIDLHRDEMPDETRLVTEVDGRKVAKFMFFNGLSRTKKTGNIEYLYNENLEDNLAFSFKMQLAAEEYYPGVARKIYLKGYRYNMHLMPRTLLIELGAQNNTLEEAVNSCDIIAHLLDLVLSGEVS